ncbi:hypothetical protein F5B17DRAFT_436761 [Nemania serpens]|nr:hypothetical protein F5B17DRAFT_436761 [Nemania serpens]
MSFRVSVLPRSTFASLIIYSTAGSVARRWFNRPWRPSNRHVLEGCLRLLKRDRRKAAGDEGYLERKRLGITAYPHGQ